ncbi:MAG: hypothetical protein AB2L24_33800 [Mangrovibacterium sp.]
MRRFSFLFLALLPFLIITCKGTDDPDNTSYAFPEAQISLGGVVADQLTGLYKDDSSRLDRKPLFSGKITELQKQAGELKKNKESVNTDSFSNAWNDVKKGIIAHIGMLADEDIVNWMSLNDSLLKYSGEQRFAEELEKMVYNAPVPEVISEKMIKSFCYTRLYDRIYVNLLGSSEVEYEHTTGGKIRIIQDTKYPFDGRIAIKVEMQDTRYLDLFIRIPEWSEQNSVIHKGVRYNTVPGNYTEIARKWKSGDTVEIVLGFRPKVIRNDSEKIAFTFGPMVLNYMVETEKNMIFQQADPIQYLKLVSPSGKMPTFTFDGIPNETLVFQPFFAKHDPSLKRTAWIKTTPE